MKEPVSPVKIIGFALLGVLLIAAIILGVRVASLVDLTYVEMSLTPTPVPAYGNVMQVTVDPSLPTPAPVLRSGSEGEEVTKLQTRLQELGYYTSTVDGQFGPGTKNAVILFQAQHGLDADGIVGEDTREVLYSNLAHSVVLTPTPAPQPTAQGDPGYTTDGMPILVNREILLSESYAPGELVDMASYCDPNLVIIKHDGTQGERIAVDALMAMLQYAHNEGLTTWQVSAGYRTLQYQQELFDDSVQDFLDQGFSLANAQSATRLTVADPGASEHHLGLAFDITVPGKYFVDTQQSVWLAENCWDWGFIIRYTKEKEDITGYLAEPWHIRYVGTQHSLIMKRENLCLEEYLEKYAHP